jgi:hypothetical protein
MSSIRSGEEPQIHFIRAAGSGALVLGIEYSNSHVLETNSIAVEVSPPADNRGMVRKASRAHFSSRWGGTMANAVNERPPQWTWIAPKEINVFPVPHSATTMAVRAWCQRLATPMMAIV